MINEEKDSTSIRHEACAISQARDRDDFPSLYGFLTLKTRFRVT
jgi:hypothetical protein